MCNLLPTFIRRKFPFHGKKLHCLQILPISTKKRHFLSHPHNNTLILLLNLYRDLIHRRGASPKDLQELLAHKTMSMTARYAHLSHEHKKKPVSLLNGLTAPKIKIFRLPSTCYPLHQIPLTKNSIFGINFPNYLSGLFLVTLKARG
jgi:hypothetical protein